MSRPTFHFTAETGWINDPHGITYHRGRYHLFFQHVPESLVWDPDCHWGHAVSDDLFVFDRLPIALAPGDGDDGIWSGSLVTDDAGQTTIFYTSVVQPEVGIGRVRSATPDDDSWMSWTKGPVVAEPPAALDIVAYRDPFVFRDGGGWCMFVGAALADGTAAALSYRSDRIRDAARTQGAERSHGWTFDRIAARRSTKETDPVWTGALWECPQLFELDGRHIMVSSVWDADVLHYTAYAVGTYLDGVFEAETWGQLSYGTSYYAPSFFRDADGRPSLMFWLRRIEDREAGWAGAHSVPHTLRLDGGRLIATPQVGLEAYRGDAASDGRVAGAVADAIWTPGGRLALYSGSTELATVSIGAGELVLSTGEEQSIMPDDAGDVRVIVDGPIIEVSTRAGVIAAPIVSPGDGLRLSADGALRVWPLVKN